MSNIFFFKAHPLEKLIAVEHRGIFDVIHWYSPSSRPLFQVTAPLQVDTASQKLVGRLMGVAQKEGAKKEDE